MAPRIEELYRLPAPPGARAAVGWQMAAVLGLGVANGGWAATSWIGERLAYAPSLGRPWLVRPSYPDAIGLCAALVLVAAVVALALFERTRASSVLLAPAGLPVTLAAFGPLYNPWLALVWAHRWGDAPRLRGILASGEVAGFLGLAGTFAMAVVYGLLRLSRLQRVGDLHGSGHWASAREVAAAGLVSGDTSGIAVGRLGRQLLVDPMDRHALLYAPSGAGKSSCFVVPTLFRWRHSVLALDIKAELWQLTAGYRHSQHQCVVRFDPTRRGSASYNPILAIPPTDEDVAFAQDVADILVNPEGREASGGAERFFEQAARALLTGVILHVLYTERRPSLGACLRVLSSAKPTEVWERMRTAVHDARQLRGWIDAETLQPTLTHPAVASAASRLLGMDFRTATSVQATAQATLTLWEDPLVVEHTTASDFRAEDLIDGEVPVSVYLTVAPSDLDRLRPLLRIVLAQLARHLTREVRRDRRQVLLVLDEFTALGKLDHLQRALAFLRGYGIRVLLSIQSLDQLNQVYGPHQSIAANCAVQIACGANDLATAQALSEMTGRRTVEYRRESRHRALLGGRRTESEAEIGRPLLSPDEVRRLPPGDALIYVAGCAPIRGERVPYWRDTVLVARAAIVPPETSDRPRRRAARSVS